MNNDMAEKDKNLPVAIAGQIMTLDEYTSLIIARDQFILKYLKRGKDYAKIKGWQKEGLLEPGAEKLCELFHLRPEFEIVRLQVDFDRPIPFIAYWIKCTLFRKDTDKKAGDAIASCNTMEEKYRYRWVKKDDLPEGTDLASVVSKKTDYGIKYRVINEETAALDNTIIQIAEKRAYVAVVRKSTQTSDRFVSGEESAANGAAKPTTPAKPGNKITVETKSVILLSMKNLSEEEQKRLKLKLDIEHPKTVTEKDLLTEADGQKVIKFIGYRERVIDLKEKLNNHFVGDLEAVDKFCRETLKLNSAVEIDKLVPEQIETLDKALEKKIEDDLF